MTHPLVFGQKFTPIRRFSAWITHPFWPHIPNMTQYGSAPRVPAFPSFTSFLIYIELNPVSAAVLETIACGLYSGFYPFSFFLTKQLTTLRIIFCYVKFTGFPCLLVEGLGSGKTSAFAIFHFQSTTKANLVYMVSHLYSRAVIKLFMCFYRNLKMRMLLA